MYYIESSGPPKLPHPPDVFSGPSFDWHYVFVGPATQTDKQTEHIQITLDYHVWIQEMFIR